MSAASRGSLEDTPFGYRQFKDGRVVISWRGRQAAVLKDRKAAAFLTQVENLDQAGRQLAMAKVTGNFKRGNEKVG
jgi:hypothetical protein